MSLRPAAGQPPAVVHVDLDGARQIYRVHGLAVPDGPDPLFETGLRQALAFLAEHEVRATLFVIGEDLDDLRKRPLLEEAVRAGHEIGSHTFTHRWLPTLSREEKTREIVESRQAIAEALSVPVDGFRAPGFRMDAESVDLVMRAGYRYDSSRFGPRWTQLDGPAGGVAELAIPRPAPLPTPFHPSYSLLLGGWYFRLGLARHGAGGPMVLLFHLTDFADPLPASWRSGLTGRIFTLSFLSAETKRRRCAAMLRRVRTQFRLASTREALRSAWGPATPAPARVTS